MVKIERGRIYWCRLDRIEGHEQGSTRPVVVISADGYNATQSPLVGVVPLTKSAPKTPLHLRLVQADTGLELESTALTDHLRFLDRARLSSAPAGRLTTDALARLERLIVRVLGLTLTK